MLHLRDKFNLSVVKWAKQVPKKIIIYNQKIRPEIEETLAKKIYPQMEWQKGKLAWITDAHRRTMFDLLIVGVSLVEEVRLPRARLLITID